MRAGRGASASSSGTGTGAGRRGGRPSRTWGTRHPGRGPCRAKGHAARAAGATTHELLRADAGEHGVGRTATPNRRPIHAAAASRYAGAPIVGGYPVAAAAASASAAAPPRHRIDRRADRAVDEAAGHGFGHGAQLAKRSAGTAGGRTRARPSHFRLPGPVGGSGGCAAAFAVQHHNSRKRLTPDAGIRARTGSPGRRALRQARRLRDGARR